MSKPVKVIITHSCCTYLACLVVVGAVILSSEGIPTPEAKRSNRSENTEMRTTTAQRAETDQATEKEGGYSSTLANDLSSLAMASRSQATTQDTTTNAQSAESTSAATRRLQNTTSSFFTTGFNTTHSPGGNLNTTGNAETRSSPRTDDVTGTFAAHPMTVTTTDQPGNFTPEVINTATSHSNTSTAATVSTASGTSSIFSSTESTQRSTVDNVSPTGTDKTANPTEFIPLEAPVTPTPDTTTMLVDELGGNVAQLIDSSSTPDPNSSPNNGSMDLRNQNPGTTPVLVVVFGLITLIPLAIFFHCRVRRGGFKMLTSKSKKQDDNVESGDTHENSKPGHQRNTSISSIKLKENSTLLGNELPLDVNMNKPAPIPPSIVITPPPDVTIESSFGAQQARKKERRRKQHNLPDTQFWFPDDGSKETPYFVTDNVPLPVSLV